MSVGIGSLAHISQLKVGQSELQKRLREAEEARYAKEGEVSILRMSISKVYFRNLSLIILLID